MQQRKSDLFTIQDIFDTHVCLYDIIYTIIVRMKHILSLRPGRFCI